MEKLDILLPSGYTAVGYCVSYFYNSVLLLISN